MEKARVGGCHEPRCVDLFARQEQRTCTHVSELVMIQFNRAVGACQRDSTTEHHIVHTRSSNTTRRTDIDEHDVKRLRPPEASKSSSDMDLH